jgi:ribose 5-phosphate isomerase B
MNIPKTKIILAADHGGFDLKEKVKKWLQSQGIEFQDYSPKLINEDDYPDVAFKAAQRVAKAKEMGVFICGTGIGMCMAANKVKGIRAAMAYDETSARLSRQHNDANVICLGGRTTSEKTAILIVKTWLTTRFLEGHYTRRNDKIRMYEGGL